jgi:hypothetical protein
LSQLLQCDPHVGLEGYEVTPHSGTHDVSGPAKLSLLNSIDLPIEHEVPPQLKLPGHGGSTRFSIATTQSLWNERR